MIATHVIASDGRKHLIRRTPKLMISLCRTPNILYLDWLLLSYREKKLQDCSHHLVVNDHTSEKEYSFSMKHTLYAGKERRKDGGLLADWRVLFCKGVAGNRAPKHEDLNLIIQAAGGSVMNHSELPFSNTEDRSRVFVITSDPADLKQTSDSIFAKVAEDGAGFHTISWLFDSIMHQKLIRINV